MVLLLVIEAEPCMRGSVMAWLQVIVAELLMRGSFVALLQVIVAEPCVSAMTDSSEDPLVFKEFTTGTIQAEQRFRTGPSKYPLNIPFSPGANNIV